MSTKDPFDRVRKSNPVDPQDLPGAPLGMTDRIIAETSPRRLNISGPALGLVSMAFVLVVGAATTAIIVSGSEGAPVAGESTTIISTTPTTSATQEGSTPTTHEPNGTGGGVAPWSAPPLPQSAVPQHLIADWAGAANQTWCSALFPEDPRSLSPAGVSRSADFSGGWAVAWDLPNGPGRDATDGYCPDCGRSAFGIAGADFTGTVNDLAIWPNQIAWSDGSRAGHGLEGLEAPGSGAPELAYLKIDGQGCLYNVWSFLGEEHLLELLDSLRFVEGMQAEPVQLVDRANLETREMGAAPWTGPAIPASEVPSVFFDEWNEDLGTTACPMMAFTDLGPEGEGAVVRRANGDGALMVAWDLPEGPGRYGSGDYCADCGRGAFGTSLSRPGMLLNQQQWNPTLRFDDGSPVWIFPELSSDLPADRIVHIDPETGARAPEAYEALVEVPEDPGCLYRVWSSYGPDHVEYLVGQMRYVEN